VRRMTQILRATTDRCTNTTTGVAQEPTGAVPYGYRKWRRANRAAGRAPGVTSGVGSTHPEVLFERKPRRARLDLPPSSHLAHPS